MRRPTGSCSGHTLKQAFSVSLLILFTQKNIGTDRSQQTVQAQIKRRVLWRLIGSILLVIHQTVLDISTNGNTNVFKFLDKYDKESRCPKFLGLVRYIMGKGAAVFICPYCPIWLPIS